MEDYCKSCKHDEDIGFCDKCYYNHILEEKGIPPTEYEAKHKPITRADKTRADKIRAMTDEELDKFLGEVQWDVANYCGGVTQKQEYPVPEQKGAWLDWLREEGET